MSVEHTKLPWGCDEVNEYWRGNDNSFIIYGTSGNGNICLIFDGFEAKANAEFIVNSCNSHDTLVNTLKNIIEQAQAFKLELNINQKAELAMLDKIINKAYLALVITETDG